MEESSVVADDVGNPVCDLLLEQEVLMVEDDFAVNVLHEDPERLRRAVHLLVPLEVWRDRQLHTQGRPGRRKTLTRVTIFFTLSSTHVNSTSHDLKGLTQ